MRPATPSGRAPGSLHLALLSLAALSLPVNFLILAVTYWAATHQASQTQPAGGFALLAAALLVLLMGSMVWTLKHGRVALSAALAALQVIPGLVVGATLVFAALR